MNDIPLDCGCDIRWLYGNEDMLHYFDSGARCASGVALKDVSMIKSFPGGLYLFIQVEDRKLMDIHNSDDFSVKTEDLYEKTILDLTCPPNREF